MDRVAIREKITEAVRKYKYVAAVLLLGMVLMVLPESTESEAETVIPEVMQAETGIAEQLEEILSQIDGVGKAEVLLTESAGEKTIYQTDEDSSYSSDSQSVRVETVIISSSDRGEYGLIQQINPPTYQGAVVVCEGAERPSIRLSVVEAVSNATGIPTDRITVLKMK